MDPTKQTLTLEEVRNVFEKWRVVRKNRCPIPEALWQCVHQLKSGYSLSNICKTLRINSKQYKQHVSSQRNSRQSEATSSAPKPIFIEVPSKLLESTSPSAAQLSMQLSRKDGTRLMLTALSEKQFEQAFSWFLQGV